MRRLVGGRRAKPRARCAALALVAAVVAAGTLVPSAGAHATLVRSEPADASSAATPPKLITLWFSEALSSSLSVVRFRDAQGDIVSNTKLDLAGAGSGRIALALPKLPRGVYNVDWAVLSEEDGHVTEGGIAFGVGTPAPPAGQRDPAGPVPGLDVLFRWLGFVCLAGIVGGLAVATLVFGPLTTSTQDGSVNAAAKRARTRALELAAVSAVGWALVGPGILLSQASTLATARASAEEVAWQLLSESRWGSLWLAREVLVLALFFALVRLLRSGQRQPAVPRRRSLTLPVTISLALALVGVQALSGHAFAVTPNRAFAVGIASVHLLAALVWIGGVLAVVVSLWPLLGKRRPRSAALTWACLAPFSVLALGSFGLLVVTGLYYAGLQVASLDALLTTLYGQALLSKVGLMLGVGAVGLLTTLTLRPQLAAPLARLLRRPDGWTPLPATRLRSLLVAEAALGLGLLVAVSVLTATPPARGPTFAQAPDATPSFRSGSAEDLLVSLSVKPNQPGENVFEVGAANTIRPAPGAIERVLLRFTGPQGSVTSPPLEEIEPGRYRTSGSYLGESGAWNIEMLVDRAGLDQSGARFEWAVAPSGPPLPVLISQRPLGPILTSAAALLLFVSLVAACCWLLVRRVPQRRRVAVEALIRQGLEESAK